MTLEEYNASVVIRDGEMEAWTVAVPNFSMNPFKQRGYKKFFQWLKEQKGFFGVHSNYPRGTLLLFKAENDAKCARNLISGKWNIPVGCNIVKVAIPKEYAGQAKDYLAKHED